jgi:basic membrane protein A
MALLVAACSGEPLCADEAIVCAGLVTDTGGIDDHGLNQGAWEGLQAGVADETIQHTAFIETMDRRDYLSNIGFFAQRDYDLVITVGAGGRDDTARAAAAYPEIRFLALDQDQTLAPENLQAIVFPEDQMGFLAGAAAALLTRTGVVAAVCESSDIDSMWRYCQGFRRGAEHIDPHINAVASYREGGSATLLFADAAWGEAAAREAIQAGADVIFGAGGGTGQGALRAAAEAGVYAIGAEQDQWYALPEVRPVLVTSVYPDGAAAVYDGALRVVSGDAGAGEYAGPVALAPFHDLELVVPTEVWDRLNEVLDGLRSGALETGLRRGGSD